MSEVDTVAVLGAGDMGHGIAELAAMNGYTVTLRDIEQDLVDEALDKIEWSLGKLAERDEITDEQADASLERISGTTELPEAVGEADLVIEAVPEDLSLKQKVFADVEQHAPDDAVLASNTSTIRITEIGEKLEDPSRLVGMHFFNPVLLMDLVEVIPSETATDEAVATVEEVSEQIGKTTVTLSRDTPGFVTSRLVGVWTGTAQMALEAGMADKETIDAAMKFGAGFPMGPFELADYTGGIQIRIEGKQDHLEDDRPMAYDTEVCPLLHQLYKKERDGRKTSAGYYEYDERDEPRISAIPDRGSIRC